MTEQQPQEFNELMPGTELAGRFRIIDRLSRVTNREIGGPVYKALALGPIPREVAIKQLISKPIFYHEARMLAGIKHTAIPFLIDAFIIQPYTYIVMEYIPGDTLGDKLGDGTMTYALREILVWATRTLEVLEHLHTRPRPVIHRDLKPDNLKVGGADGLSVFVLDFGIAKTDDGRTTMPARNARTFIYASPEQHKGEPTVVQSDLYSFSATFYHLLTGHPPADADDRMEKQRYQQTDPLIPIQERNKEVPEAVVQVLERALALQIDERPQDAATMRQIFEAELQKLPGGVGGPRTAGNYRLRRARAQVGLGTLYEGERIDGDTPTPSVLVLHIPPYGYADQESLAHIESRCRLKHARIPEVIDSFEQGADEGLSGYFLVYSVPVGRSLAGYRLPAPTEIHDRQIGVDAVARAIGWLDQALDALEYLHTAQPQVLVGDLSPQSMQVSGNELKDFTLLYWGPPQRPSHSSVTLGAAYLPPEQLKSNQFSPESDLFALTSVMYELLTGERPADARQRELEVEAGTDEDDPLRPAAELNPHVPLLLSQVLQRAMALNPQRRYPNATAFRAALAPLIAVNDLQKQVAPYAHYEKLIIHANGGQTDAREPLAPLSRIDQEHYGNLKPLIVTNEWPYKINRALWIIEDVLDALICLHAATGKPHNYISLRTIVVDADDTRLLVDVERHRVRSDERLSPPDEPVTPVSDQFSLAALTYYLLSGRYPSSASERQDAREVGRDDPLLPIATLNARVPPRLGAIVGKALALEPVSRYPDARAMRKELQPLLKARDIEEQISSDKNAELLVVYAKDLPAATKEELNKQGFAMLSTVQGQRLSPAQVASVVAELAAALDLLHFTIDSPAPHGNLSAQTVWVSGERARLMLDMLVNDDDSSRDRRFYAPEQWSGSVCRESDRFALAALSFYMLTAQALPPMHQQEPGSGEQIKKGLQEALGSRTGGLLSRRLTVENTARVLVRAMHFEPTQRFYRSCEGYSRALREAMVMDRIIS